MAVGISMPRHELFARSGSIDKQPGLWYPEALESASPFAGFRNVTLRVCNSTYLPRGRLAQWIERWSPERTSGIFLEIDPEPKFRICKGFGSCFMLANFCVSGVGWAQHIKIPQKSIPKMEFPDFNGRFAKS